MNKLIKKFNKNIILFRFFLSLQTKLKLEKIINKIKKHPFAISFLIFNIIPKLRIFRSNKKLLGLDKEYSTLLKSNPDEQNIRVLFEKHKSINEKIILEKFKDNYTNQKNSLEETIKLLDLDKEYSALLKSNPEEQKILDLFEKHKLINEKIILEKFKDNYTNQKKSLEETIKLLDFNKEYLDLKALVFCDLNLVIDITGLISNIESNLNSIRENMTEDEKTNFKKKDRLNELKNDLKLAYKKIIEEHNLKEFLDTNNNKIDLIGKLTNASKLFLEIIEDFNNKILNEKNKFITTPEILITGILNFLFENGFNDVIDLDTNCNETLNNFFTSILTNENFEKIKDLEKSNIIRSINFLIEQK